MPCWPCVQFGTTALKKPFSSVCVICWQGGAPGACWYTTYTLAISGRTAVGTYWLPVIAAPVVGLKCFLNAWQSAHFMAALVVPPVQSYASGIVNRPLTVNEGVTAPSSCWTSFTRSTHPTPANVIINQTCALM
jgi:hypothetical protein